MLQERRQALIRKSMERDNQLERRNKRSFSGLAFGSRSRRMVCDTVDASKRAASQGSLLRPHLDVSAESPEGSDSGGHVQRRAVSACSLTRKGAPATTADKMGMRMIQLTAPTHPIPPYPKKKKFPFFSSNFLFSYMYHFQYPSSSLFFVIVHFAFQRDI